MKLEEQCTTIEQSRRLLELGFDKDTASLRWYEMPTGKWEINNYSYVVPLEVVYCWTIADMMSIIHNEITEIYWEEYEAYHGAELIIDSNKYVYLRNVATGDCDDIEFYDGKLLRDNLFDCLIWLKENKYL